jgi:hypothetical protein
VNEVRFHTKEYAQTCTTQSRGIVVKAGYNMLNIEYYGELKNVLELCYPGQNRVYLFECDWCDTSSSRRIRKEQGFTIVHIFS